MWDGLEEDFDFLSFFFLHLFCFSGFFFWFRTVAPVDSEKGEMRGKACSVEVLVIFMCFLHAFVIFVVLVCIHLELILLTIFISILFSCSVYFNDL